jgi:L-fucose mutarotase
MLKGIPSIISPELIKILMEMGHGDEIVIADGNFPAASTANRLLRMDGQGCEVILKAVLNVFPLDQYVDKPVCLMEVVNGDLVKTPIWERYARIIAASGEHKKFHEFEFLERFAFYERARKAFAILATSESARYANIILKKGCILDE